jgi:hypothetical protein
VTDRLGRLPLVGHERDGAWSRARYRQHQQKILSTFPTVEFADDLTARLAP